MKRHPQRLSQEFVRALLLETVLIIVLERSIYIENQKVVTGRVGNRFGDEDDGARVEDHVALAHKVMFPIGRLGHLARVRIRADESTSADFVLGPSAGLDGDCSRHRVSNDPLSTRRK